MSDRAVRSWTAHIQEDRDLQGLLQPLEQFWNECHSVGVPLLQEALNRLTDHLGQMGLLYQLAEAERAQFQGLLAGLRQFAETFGLVILPRDWTFVPLQVPPGDDAVECVIVFRPQDEVGSLLRLKQLGLQSPEEVIQPAKLSVSAGPAPVGFAELEEAILAHPECEALAQQLKTWRRASWEGTLELAAVEFFLAYWHQPIREGLDELVLAVLLEGFNFTPFFPQRFQDHPTGWIQLAEGNRMTTGRVRQLLRPGLLDLNGELRVPARVIVE